jgi:hypothetical protein
MDDGGGRGQQLVMRQEIYSVTTGNIARNIQTFIRIFRHAYFALLCGIRTRHISYPTRNAAFTAECPDAAGTGPRGPADGEMLLRRRRAAESDLVAVWVAEGGFAVGSAARTDRP